MWWSVKAVEMFTAKVAHAFSRHSWWELLAKTEQIQWQRWKGKKDTGFSPTEKSWPGILPVATLMILLQLNTECLMGLGEV